MYSLLSRLRQFTSAGYGVVIGEYGALPANDGYKANAPAYHKAFMDCCDALDLTSCLWDCSGYFIRSRLIMGDEEMAAVYAGRNAASEAGKDYADIAAAGKAALDSAMEAAPDSLISTDFTLTDDTCADVEITGPGTYTVALDFTGTEKGYAENTAFSAVGISNGKRSIRTGAL